MTKQSRIEFEKWCVADSGPSVDIIKDGEYAGQYENDLVENMWMAWQASRSAITVELPQPDVVNFGEFYSKQTLKKAIEAQGLTVK